MRNCTITGVQDVHGEPYADAKIKGYYAISGRGSSKCIGIATFKFPYGDVVLEFDAPIVKDADFPLILGLCDQDRLSTHGANQKENSISFGDGLSQKISGFWTSSVAMEV